MTALIVAWVLARVEASSVVVGVLEVLRYSVLVAWVSNCTTVARTTRVRSGLELLFGASMLVAAEVVNLVGVLAVDNLSTVAMAVAAVTSVAMAIRSTTRASVVVAGRTSLHVIVCAVVIGGVVLGLVLVHSVIVAYLLAGVESSTMVVGVLEVLRNRTLVSGVSNSTAVVMAARVRSRLELLFGSSMLVRSPVVKAMAVAAASGCIISLVTSTSETATSVDGIGIDLAAVKFLRLLNESGKGSRALVAGVMMAVTVTMSVTMTVTMTVAMTVAVNMIAMSVMGMGIGKVVLNCASSSSEASKSESLEHNEVYLKN